METHPNKLQWSKRSPLKNSLIFFDFILKPLTIKTVIRIRKDLITYITSIHIFIIICTSLFYPISFSPSICVLCWDLRTVVIAWILTSENLWQIVKMLEMGHRTLLLLYGIYIANIDIYDFCLHVLQLLGLWKYSLIQIMFYLPKSSPFSQHSHKSTHIPINFETSDQNWIVECHTQHSDRILPISSPKDCQYMAFT